MALQVTSTQPGTRDPLDGLRAYQALEPWSLRDLAALAGTLLEASAVVPLNATARTRPSERTIRFYVARGLVDSPDGRGTAAIYRYRHLVQVLAIKLHQMEGSSLEQVSETFAEHDPEDLEVWVAKALGPGIPTPVELGPLGMGTTRGRTRRALGGDGELPAESGSEIRKSTLIRRFTVAPGAELALDVHHPLFKHTASDDSVARAIATALDELAKELAEE